VDLADQLRSEYRPDAKWWRNKKWWWAIFLWLFGVVCTNAYKIMLKRCEEEGIEKSKIRSHKEFLVELATQLSTATPTQPKKRKKPTPVSTPAFNTASGEKRKRRAVVTEVFMGRTETVRKNGEQHLLDDVDENTRINKGKCQWCRFVDAKPQKTAKIVCNTCEGTMFCSIKCLNEFHQH
jgi:hypothetical protein